MSAITFKVTGRVDEIGDLIHTKKTGAPDLYKKVVTLVTSDDQVLYVDVINSRIKTLTTQNISVGDIVVVEISFKGSQKDKKKYNNIFCNSINLYK